MRPSRSALATFVCGVAARHARWRMARSPWRSRSSISADRGRLSTLTLRRLRPIWRRTLFRRSRSRNSASPRRAQCHASRSRHRSRKRFMRSPSRSPAAVRTLRARDVLDVLLLVQRVEIDHTAVRAACERIFAERALTRGRSTRLPFRLAGTAFLPSLRARCATIRMTFRLSSNVSTRTLRASPRRAERGRRPATPRRESCLRAGRGRWPSDPAPWLCVCTYNHRLAS